MVPDQRTKNNECKIAQAAVGSSPLPLANAWVLALPHGSHRVVSWPFLDGSRELLIRSVSATGQLDAIPKDERRIACKKIT